MKDSVCFLFEKNLLWGSQAEKKKKKRVPYII